MIKFDLKVEKDIPIPIHSTAAMKQLNLGESFVIPWPKSKPNTLSIFAKRAKIKIVTRRVDDETIRIWRIE